MSISCALLWAGAGRASTSVEAVSQILMRHMSQGVHEAKPGDWISYRVNAGGGRVSFWRFSVVGAEKDSRGRDAIWIEIEVGQHGELLAPLAQIRILVAHEAGLTPRGVTRVFVALGADQPREIAPDELDRLLPPGAALGRKLPTPMDSLDTIRPGPEIKLMTLAGTLPAVPVEIYRQGSLVQRVWMSYRLPLLHLAKLEIPAIGHAMEVNGFGLNASARLILPAADEPRIRLERGARTAASP